jgi:hypothetical protein
MPQLDQYSFFTQYFWLFVCFLGFYFLILKIFLPQIAQMLKVRAAIMVGSKSELQALIVDRYFALINNMQHEVDGINSSSDLFTTSYDNTCSWYRQKRWNLTNGQLGLVNIQDIFLQKSNLAYLHTVARLSISENSSVKHFESLLAPTASVNKALSSYPQREVAFDKALFQNLKWSNL